MAAYTNYDRDPRVRREAEALADAGHHVTFLASRHPGQPARQRIAGIEVRRVPMLNAARRSTPLQFVDYMVFFCALLLHTLLRPRWYALVHVNNMPDFLVLATAVPRLFGRPVIHDVHDLMPELFAEKFAGRPGSFGWRLLVLQERLAGRFASAVITVEDRLRDILATRGIPRDKIQVLLNLPDERIFSSSRTRHAKPPDAPFVIVYHGTLARRLGLDVAIDAVALAREQVPTLRFRIIGAGEERASLISQRDRLGLTDVVEFSEGFVPVEQVPELLSDADVGVVPLRISSGTDIMLPTKLLEYVFLTIPAIVPRTGTVSRYFDGEMVEFFEAEDPRSLSDAIVKLARSPARRSHLAAEATRRFGAVYTWSRHRMTYVSLVARLIRERDGT
jgi:glycosyltransferase involved in cell wall biosynthesis